MRFSFLVAAVLLVLGMGCGREDAGKLNSVEDLENQIERQLRKMDLDKRPDEVRLLQFRPSGGGGFSATLRLEWNRRAFTNTDVQFVSLADHYAVGSIALPEFKQPANVLLHFPE